MLLTLSKGLYRPSEVYSLRSLSISASGMFNIWRVMDKCAPVAKKEVFYVWPFGLGAWLAGVVFIDRLNSKKAHEQLTHASKLMKTHKVLMFITIWYSENVLLV
jgi:1-acyl-sn-glycerol-3-phosphate acyltransferase